MSPSFIQKLKERFDKFVIRNSEGCWDWKGCCPKNPGYGQFRLDMIIQRAHRASWMIYKGQIPEGIFVCHSCDNKRCSNPNHLFLGTCKENNLDAINKNILPFGKKGIENHRCKISDEQVNSIRDMLYKKISQYKIAKIFGVSQPLISLIKNGKLRGGLFLKQA